MTFRETRDSDGKTIEHRRLAHQLDGVVKAVGMGPPISHALRRIAAQREQVFDAFFLEPLKDCARLSLRLSNHSQMAHHIETTVIMDSFDQLDGFFARASARPVRDRTEAGIEPLYDFDLAKEVFLAFFCLWRKEFDREGQPRSGIEVGQLHRNS
jgi:hypothetical protein